VAEAFSFGPVTNSLKGEFTAGVFLEYLADQGSAVWIDFNEMTLSVIEIADRGNRGPVALRGFLVQALFNFLAQIVDIVFCHQYFDPVHEFL